MPETNDTKLYEKIIARREVFRGKLIRVEHWDAELASGRVSLREIVKKTGAHSTDLEAPESAEHLCEKCRAYADCWRPEADRLWAEEHE